MKKEFAEYLHNLGMAEPLLQRTEAILNFYSDLLPGEIEDIFVSEYVKDDGTRSFETFWIFTNEHICEAKNFLDVDNFDIARLVTITHFILEKKDYDMRNSTASSRMKAMLAFHSIGLNATLKASAENCDRLAQIIRKHAVPRL
jgi:hypothetical protein